MHSRETVAEALRLRDEEGLGARRVARHLGLPVGTVRDWHAGRLLKGLIQSDGCRFTNTGRGGWRHPRYAFSNVSTDITSIFCSACDCLGLR